jgi:hypothetical protein
MAEFAVILDPNPCPETGYTGPIRREIARQFLRPDSGARFRQASIVSSLECPFPNANCPETNGSRAGLSGLALEAR